MQLAEVEAFEAIWKLGGFTRGAAALRISQPTISRRIELLEKELGAPLFERGVGKGASPLLTEAGRAFLPHARQILAAVRDGAEAVRSLERGEEGVIELALVGTLASTDLTARLKRFRKDHPKVRITLRTVRSDEASEMVRSGEATLGLRYFADEHPAVISEPAGEEPLVVVCSPESRLAEGEPSEPEALLGVPWVSFPIGSPSSGEPYARALWRQLIKCGLEDAEIIAIDSLTAQKRLIEADFGIGLLPHSSVEEEVEKGTLRELKIAALRATIPVVTVRRRGAYLSRAARDLISELNCDWQ